MTEKCNSENRFLLFWLGVLTGALLVGIIFLYRLYIADMGGANLFRSVRYMIPKVTNTQVMTTKSTGAVSPVSAGDPQPWAPVAAGDPQPW